MFYGIPDILRLDEWADMNIPFEYNDFMWPNVLDDTKALQERIGTYLSLNRDTSKDTLHGPFLDIAVHSKDTLIRKVSDMRIRQSCDIAVALGVKAVIFHTNLIPNFYDSDYREGWVKSNFEYFSKLLNDYPRLNVYMENMFDEEPDTLVLLAEKMNSDRFGIALDIAHANLSKMGIAEWNDACLPYIRHYHLNDNHGKLDEHLSVGEGNIDWERVVSLLKPDASVLIELNSLEDYKRSKNLLEHIKNSICF